MEKINVSTVYSVVIEKYYHNNTINDSMVSTESGNKAIITITEEEYKQLVEAGCKHEDYDTIVFAKEPEDDLPFYNRVPIRQFMHKHVAYVEKASHTNY